jgi:hypothetical protein
MILENKKKLLKIYQLNKMNIKLINNKHVNNEFIAVKNALSENILIKTNIEKDLNI